MGDNYCEICQKSFGSLAYLRKHEQTKKHKETLICPKNKKKFFCELCNYSTDIKCNFNIHISSQKHKNVQLIKEQESYNCLPCKVALRDRTDFERHKRTKKHIFLTDSFHDMERSKLDILVSDMVLHASRKYPIPLEQSSNEKIRIMRPDCSLCFHTDTNGYLAWVKNILEPFAHKFSEQNGTCRFVWPNHPYLLSKRDFAYIIVSASSRILQEKIKYAREQAKYLNSVLGCEQHRKDPKKWCEQCLPEVRLELFGFDEQKHSENVSERLRTILSNTTSSRESSLGYWKWWREEGEFSEQMRILESLSSTSIKETIQGEGRFPVKKMTETEFMEVLRRTSYRTKGTDGFNKKIKTLVFLENIRKLAVPPKFDPYRIKTEREVIDKQCSASAFYFSLCSRITSVEKNIFNSYFGFEKESRFSKEVEETVEEVWKISS